MNILIEKEKELMKLNAQIDAKNRKIENESPKKKPAMRGRTPKPKGSRPPSRSRELEVHFASKDKEDEKYVWAPIPSQEQNHYIWAPISQEDLFEDSNKERCAKIKDGKKIEKKIQSSTENISEKEKIENVISDVERTIPDESKDDEFLQYEDMEKHGNNRAEQTQQRMLNIKIRGLETALDKINFEKSEVIQEKEQLEKEVKILDDQRRRLDATNRNFQSQLEKAKGELVDLRHKLNTAEEEIHLLKKEADEAKRDAKKNLSKKSSSDVRLNRALEEATKLRGELSAAEREKKDAKENGKKSVDELTLKTKFLEKQRNELLHGFKKQMELIDVLKRQKLHLEAAHVLKYTEEEFMQTLDWKPNMSGSNSVGSSGN